MQSREREREARHTHKVTVLEVEAVQLVTGLLRIHDILVDDKGRALGVGRNPLADLTVHERYG